jgi:hypothetical protein
MWPSLKPLRIFALLIVAVGSIVSPPLSTVAQASSSPDRTCPATFQVSHIPTPPAGFAALVDTKVLSNCQLQTSPAKLVPIAEMRKLWATPVKGATTNASIDSVFPAITGNPMASPGMSVAQLSASALTSTSTRNFEAHSRSWDCCGIKMTELNTYLQWQYNGSAVTSGNAHNTAQYKSEQPAFPGWYINNQTVYWSGGCFGCSYIQVTGHIGFGYRGIFDTGGSKYYNDHYSWITGDALGYGSCSTAIYWRNYSLNWSRQEWCTGPY